MIDYDKLKDIHQEMARKHAEIIEEQCIDVINKFNCKPTDLIIEYHVNNQFKIKIMGAEFQINNVFTFEGKEL